MRDRSDVSAPRVLYCTDTYPPQVNGVSVVTALSVAGLRARGWECAVVAPRYPAVLPQGPLHQTSVDAERFDVASVSFPPYPDIRLAAPSYGVVASAVRRFRPDIVHSATEFMIGRLGQIAAARAGIVRVSSYHTDFSRYSEAYGLPCLRGPVSRYIARFHQRSARVFTPSGPARDDLRALGVTDVEVWGRGVDLAAFSPERRSQSLRTAYGVDRSVVFVHVGRLAAEKRVERVMRAFARAEQSLPAGAARLIIAGAGPEEASLRRLSGPDVLFLGVLDRERALPRLYASFDAFLFSSVTETLGLVVLEPMASGIVALTLDVARRRRLGEGARRTALALDWEAELDRLDASYRGVLGRAGKPTAHSAATTGIFDERTARRAAG
jgi:glycosyltransferase involved in cell wall biosynthesis